MDGQGGYVTLMCTDWNFDDGKLDLMGFSVDFKVKNAQKTEKINFQRVLQERSNLLSYLVHAKHSENQFSRRLIKSNKL